MLMAISRSEGYRRGMGKEGPGLATLQTLMERRVGVQLSPITDATENFEYGDFVASSGESIECKSQPIDPVKYPKNFVEVCEATNNPRHEGGFDELASILRLRTAPRVDLFWSPPRSYSKYPLADEPRLSVSVHTFVKAALVGYVNPDKHVYIYRSGDLLDLIRQAALRGPLVRGAGNSNADTFAVFVPVADWRWSVANGTWAYSGRGGEYEAVQGIRTALRLA